MNNNEVTPEAIRKLIDPDGDNKNAYVLGDLSDYQLNYIVSKMEEYAQSLLVERDKRIAELETISADDDHVILILQDQLKISEERIKELENQNERLKAMVKEAEEIGGYRF